VDRSVRLERFEEAYEEPEQIEGEEICGPHLETRENN